ncbi:MULTISPECIES: ABC transporter permease [Pseudonocardia]|uniref:ABC transporter permease YtrF n=2 Tax=Pseudonocardia TaxID=1847 RepID=A0A1Y2MH25_PSEAH|nr:MULTISPECIES: ABC transporter permease [Pseudonocardia]OSY34584.1 ABC transporter permease YtrF precursor [Pseudonocardia autotrophica]TDN71843.1 putative ABC transport system permease protein [Pseudonocardia autotrophica]BBG02531.1 permease [Pseudonocardia autotrophica]GEC29431.1 permease [Pseudonocardia saturnea]
MRTRDLVRTAVGSTFRARARTLLTVLAIFVGAFTLTLTNGAGTGINRFIDSTVSGLGSAEVMTVVKRSDADVATESDGPPVYNPDAVTSDQPGPPTTTTAMTQADIDTLAGIDGVEEAAPIRSLAVDFIRYENGTRFATTATALLPGQTQERAEGVAPDGTGDARQLTIPLSYVDTLGFTDARDALDRTVTLGLTDGAGAEQTVQGTIVGVTEDTLAGPASPGVTVNASLSDAVYGLQQVGLPADQVDRWSGATVQYAPDITPEQLTALKDRLVDAGFEGRTVEDQIGAFTSVIDTIVWVLNAFAGIALVAAGLGIVNTLLMSVQERTREIGLMQAMGMGRGRVFALFSLEAVFLGLLGSVLGAVIAIGAGTAISTALSGTLFADLPGLTLIAFAPATVLAVIALIVAVAFLAGTLPAIRAARKDPVEALRHE